jgi:IS5 family transposase
VSQRSAGSISALKLHSSLMRFIDPLNMNRVREGALIILELSQDSANARLTDAELGPPISFRIMHMKTCPRIR